ncbi:MAG: hypothetical protein A2X56_02035 [Nitrospirae bacterium GWC2_57_13]|nr:MAG: hypothetical protein A2X56_02035 [Nitrospirae bacterium GWC2_57_13]OGW46388.1 MAG: hypothetical protein A2X57_03315 [Nitrospirae bacterium GWD2_57_8]
MIIINKRTFLNLGLVIAFFALVTYVLYHYGVLDLFTDRARLISFIQQHRGYAAFIFIGLQVLQVVAAPVPGEVTGFAGGVLFGPLWGIVLSTIGLTLGSWLAFGIARLLGRPLVERIVSADTIRQYDYIMKHKGLFLAFLMFLIPGFPKDLLCYILGLGHMSQRDFLLVSTVGRLLGTTMLTMGGTFLRVGRYGAFFTVLGVSIGLILFAMIYREKIERWFRSLRAAERIKTIAEHRRQRKHQSKQAEGEGPPSSLHPKP